MVITGFKPKHGIYMMI